MNDKLFGKCCYIDTPWIAGKKTVYRILASGVESNTYCNVPVTGKTKPELHKDFEQIVYVVLDTLVSENSEILRFALKDVEITDDESKEVKCGEWQYHSNPFSHINPEDAYCSICGFWVCTPETNNFDDYNFCPYCGANMRGKADG